jgi:hypothetical protein
VRKPYSSLVYSGGTGERDRRISHLENYHIEQRICPFGLKINRELKTVTNGM